MRETPICGMKFQYPADDPRPDEWCYLAAGHGGLHESVSESVGPVTSFVVNNRGVATLVDAASYHIGVGDGIVACPAYVEVDGVEWCTVHEAENVEGEYRCGDAGLGDTDCESVPLYRKDAEHRPLRVEVEG